MYFQRYLAFIFALGIVAVRGLDAADLPTPVIVSDALGISRIYVDRSSPAKLSSCVVDYHRIQSTGDNSHALTIQLKIIIDSVSNVGSVNFIMFQLTSKSSDVPLVANIVTEELDSQPSNANAAVINGNTFDHQSNRTIRFTDNIRKNLAKVSNSRVFTCGIISATRTDGSVWNSAPLQRLYATYLLQKPLRIESTPVSSSNRDAPTIKAIQSLEPTASTVHALPREISAGYYAGTINDRSGGQGSMSINVFNDGSPNNWTASFGNALENNGGVLRLDSSTSGHWTLHLSSKEAGGCSYTADAELLESQIHGTYIGEGKCASNGGNFALTRRG